MAVEQVDRPRHGEIRMTSERQASGYLLRATLYFDPRKVVIATAIREGKS